jgi:hypothetical protein
VVVIVDTHATCEEVTGSTCAKLPINIMYKVVCPPPQTVSTSAGSDGTTRHVIWTLEYILARKYSLHLLLHVLVRKYSAIWA